LLLYCGNSTFLNGYIVTVTVLFPSSPFAIPCYTAVFLIPLIPELVNALPSFSFVSQFFCHYFHPDPIYSFILPKYVCSVSTVFHPHTLNFCSSVLPRPVIFHLCVIQALFTMFPSIFCVLPPLPYMIVFDSSLPS
jgi:hypothetical protein